MTANCFRDLSPPVDGEVHNFRVRSRLQERLSAVVHRHGETDADTGKSCDQVLVGCTAREDSHVVQKDDHDTDCHQPEHGCNVPRRGWPLLVDGRGFVRRGCWTLVGLFAAL
jgi:hypothetical protein